MLQACHEWPVGGVLLELDVWSELWRGGFGGAVLARGRIAYTVVTLQSLLGDGIMYRR